MPPPKSYRWSKRTSSVVQRQLSRSKNMHTTIYLILGFLATSASATFFLPSLSSQTPNASNICIYSANPEKFKPVCFLCSSVVYPRALQACLNGTTTMPSNISYSQANCLEQNCAINYPSSKSTSPSLPQKLEALFKGSFKGKRSVPENWDPSVEDNYLDGQGTTQEGDDGNNKVLLQLDSIKLSNSDNVHITQYVETFASGDVWEPVIDYEEY